MKHVKMEGMWGLLLVFLNIVLCVRPGTSVLLTSCEVAQRSLTCYFPQDLREQRTSFALYYRHSTNNVSEIPLVCNWAKGKPQCHSHSGFEAPVTASHKFTVKIPPDANGTFICRTIPSDNNMDTKPCHFYAQDSVNQRGATRQRKTRARGGKRRRLRLMLQRISDDVEMLDDAMDGRDDHGMEVPDKYHDLITSCEVAQRSLTCYFPQDLREQRTSFALSYRHSTNNVSEIPLACNWAKGKPQCHANSGFEAPVTASHKFTVKLPPDANGTFICRTIPPDNNMDTKPCHFYAQDSVSQRGATRQRKTRARGGKQKRLRLMQERISDDVEMLGRDDHGMEVPDKYHELFTSCEVAQRSLACYFPQDLREQRTSFALYYRHATSNVSEIPLACNWARGKPQCHAISGFEAPVTASHTFTVKIPPDANGTFSCSTIPPDSNMDTKPCHFYAQDKRTKEGISTPDNVSHKPPTGDTFDNYLPAALVVILIMFVLMLLGTAVYAIIQRRRKREEGLQKISELGLPLAKVANPISKDNL